MIAADSMFLRVHNLIDYSLLLVIETIPTGSETSIGISNKAII